MANSVIHGTQNITTRDKSSTALPIGRLVKQVSGAVCHGATFLRHVRMLSTTPLFQDYFTRMKHVIVTSANFRCARSKMLALVPNGMHQLVILVAMLHSVAKLKSQ